MFEAHNEIEALNDLEMNNQDERTYESDDTSALIREIEGGPDSEAMRLFESLEIAETHANLDLAEHFEDDIGGKIDANKTSLFGKINQRVEEGMGYLQEHHMLPTTKKGFWMLSLAAAPVIALAPGGIAIGAGLYKLYKGIDAEQRESRGDVVEDASDTEGRLGWFKEIISHTKRGTVQTT